MSDLFTPGDRPLVVVGTSKGGRAVARCFPLWDQGAPMYFWAENGLVLWEDSREDCPEDKRFGSMTWHDAAIRTLNLSDFVLRSSEDGYYRDEMNQLKQFIAEMEDVVRTAKEQGSPFDDEAIEERKRRRPKTSIMPQVVDLQI